MEVVGEASSGPQAIQMVQSIHPDVLVLDLSMPGLSGLAVTQEISRTYPETRTVIFSIHGNHGYVRDALRSGASAYVLKDAPSSEVVRAVRAACAGEKYLSASISQRAIELYMQHGDERELNEYYSLTSRERQVLQLVVNGLTSNEIALRLSLGRRTVETHRANLRKKLGVRSQIDLLRYATDIGIALPTPPGIRATG